MPRCEAINKNGNRCKKTSKTGNYCYIHSAGNDTPRSDYVVSRSNRQTYNPMDYARRNFITRMPWH